MWTRWTTGVWSALSSRHQGADWCYKRPSSTPPNLVVHLPEQASHVAGGMEQGVSLPCIWQMQVFTSPQTTSFLSVCLLCVCLATVWDCRSPLLSKWHWQLPESQLPNRSSLEDATHSVPFFNKAAAQTPFPSTLPYKLDGARMIFRTML